MKWCVLKDSDGNAKSAGYVKFKPKDGESVEELDGPSKKILKELRESGLPSTLKALKGIETSTITDPTVKVLAEFLKDIYGLS